MLENGNNNAEEANEELNRLRARERQLNNELARLRRFKEKDEMRRKPQPKFYQNQTITTSSEIELSNTTNEVSIVEYIRVTAPAYLEIKVERTVGGDRQTIVEASPLWRYLNNTIDLKERGRELVVAENQSLIITLTNPKSDVGVIHAAVHIQKDQVLPKRRGE